MVLPSQAKELQVRSCCCCCIFVEYVYKTGKLKGGRSFVWEVMMTCECVGSVVDGMKSEPSGRSGQYLYLLDK